MIKQTTFLLVLILTGCVSRTQVHIFSLGVEESEIEHLGNLLSEQGFDVRPNSLPVPSRITRHTVIFPAIVQNFATIELVESAMARVGYPDARLILETEENHYYSTDNIGVYLVNPEFEGTAADLITNPYSLGGDDASNLTFNYFSECPDGSEAQSELNLYPAGVALLEEFVWDNENNREVSIVHEGEWRSDSSTVEVAILHAGKLIFSINEHSGTDWFGPYEGLTLEIQSTTMDIEKCDYTFRDHEDSNF